jgi:hypothetical protein
MQIGVIVDTLSLFDPARRRQLSRAEQAIFSDADHCREEAISNFISTACYVSAIIRPLYPCLAVSDLLI